MANGMSLHIGVNQVDPTQYHGFKGSLDGCDNDADTMAAIAKLRRFSVAPLLTESNATSTAVLAGISSAAAKLVKGDTFLLTFAGHGSTIPSAENPPDEPYDQTWALYDRLLIDDELYELWTTFKSGVRIVVVSDSCFSGTVISLMQARLRTGEVPQAVIDLPPVNVRAVPFDVAQDVYDSRRDLYAGIQVRAAKARLTPVGASVLLLSACRDSEQALDGHRNGLFTEKIIDVWQAGKFKGNYEQFWTAVQARVSAKNQYQNPDWYTVGVADLAFYHSPVFSI